MNKIKNLRKYSLIFGILYSIQAGLAIFLAFATKNVINSAVYGGNFRVWAIAFISVCIGIPIFGWVVRYTNQRITDRYVAKLRLDFINTIMTRDFEEIRKYHSGVLVSRAGSDIRTVIERKTKTGPAIMGQMVQLAGAVIVLFFMNSLIAAIAVLIGVIIASVGYLFRKILSKKQGKIKTANENVIGSITEIIENPELVRAVTDEEELTKKFNSKLEDWLIVKKTLTAFSTVGSSIFSWAIQISTCILIVWGAFQIGEGNLLYGDLVAMMQIILLFRNPISGLTGIQLELASYDASLERIQEIYNISCMDHMGIKTSDEDKIHIDNITFRYTDDIEHVFSNFSLEISTDSWTALKGNSGQGKTTLFRIMLGLIKPEKGQVSLPGGLKLFYVPQEPILFSGSIRDNMLLAKPDAKDEDIRFALDACKCDFIPEDGGLDMTINQFGNGISVGQKQRITVARTILSAREENAFLLLDEPTSSIDKETADSLLKALKSVFEGALVATHSEQLKDIFDEEININA